MGSCLLYIRSLPYRWGPRAVAVAHAHRAVGHAVPARAGAAELGDARVRLGPRRSGARRMRM
jgi:hypothetical protein